MVIQASTLLDHAGSADVFPRHFILPRKLDAHGSADRLGHYGRVKGYGICAVEPIAAGAASVDYAYALKRQSQQFGHAAPSGINRLCC